MTTTILLKSNIGKNNAGNCGEKINKFNGKEENKQCKVDSHIVKRCPLAYLPAYFTTNS